MKYLGSDCSNSKGVSLLFFIENMAAETLVAR